MRLNQAPKRRDLARQQNRQKGTAQDLSAQPTNMIGGFTGLHWVYNENSYGVNERRSLKESGGKENRVTSAWEADWRAMLSNRGRKETQPCKVRMPP